MQGYIDRGGYRYGNHIRNHMMTEPAPYVHRERTPQEIATETLAVLTTLLTVSLAVVFALLSLGV